MWPRKTWLKRLFNPSAKGFGYGDPNNNCGRRTSYCDNVLFFCWKVPVRYGNLLVRNEG